MKNLTAFLLLLLLAPAIILCQARPGVKWNVTPMEGGSIIKLNWTHSVLKNTEQISNAVVLQSGKPVQAVVGKKITLPGVNSTIIQIGDNLEVSMGGQVIVFSGFDSGHIRGIRCTMPGHAPWLGGGERATPLIRNGQRIPLFNAPAYGYGEGQDQLNYSVPFVLTTAGFGLLFDNPSKGYIDFGKTIPGMLEAGFMSGSLDVYLIPGGTPAEIITQYTRLTGRQPLPPRWALGNFVSRFGYRSQAQAEETVARMQADGFPVDAVIIDLFWFGKSIQHTLGNLDWDSDNWPAPMQMIDRFKKNNIQTILITEPFIIEGTKNYQASLPYLATDSSGKPFRLEEFYFGKGGIINLFSRRAQDWFWQFYKKQNAIGVSGWWGDLGEPEHHPAGVQYDMNDLGVKRKMNAHEVHNIYGHFWSRMVYENWKKDYPDRRLFFLNRAGYAGSQRYSIFPWTGDVGRNWSGLRAQVPSLQSTSLSGVPYIHSDAGGFAMTDTANAELYTRWLQFAAFTPVFRPHGSALGDLSPEGTLSVPSEPAYWDEKTKERALRLIRERYNLLPYNYTLAWEQTQFGWPLIRPMLWKGVADTNLLRATDQYMWGNALLVAPVLEPAQDICTLYLPAGTWYRLHDLSTLRGGRWITEKTSPERIPVFVRGGSFLPWWEKKEIRSTADYNWTDTLTLRYYPGDMQAPSYVYDDDGHTAEAQDKPMLHQLMEWTGEKKNGELILKAKAANWPKELKRVLKIQIPMAGLKNYMGAGEGDKLNITLNNISYATQTITTSGKTENWANLYHTANGLPLEIRIIVKK